MSMHNICFQGEILKNIDTFWLKEKWCSNKTYVKVKLYKAMFSKDVTLSKWI